MKLFILGCLLVFFIVSSEAKECRCKVEACEDSPFKDFTGSFTPCKVHLGGTVNVSASLIAPRDISGLIYDGTAYFADDPDTSIIEVQGKVDCDSAKKYPLPFKCPVKKGEQLGVKNQMFKIPNSQSFDSDSYIVKVKLYDTKDKSLIVCVKVCFDLVDSTEDMYDMPQLKQKLVYYP